MPKEPKDKFKIPTTIVTRRQSNKVANETASLEKISDVGIINNRERYKKWEEKNKVKEGNKKAEPPLQNDNTATIHHTPIGKFFSVFYYNFENYPNKQEALALVRKRDAQIHTGRGFVKEFLLSPMVTDGLDGSFLIPSLPYNALFQLLLIFKLPTSHVMSGSIGMKRIMNHFAYYMYDWVPGSGEVLSKNGYLSNPYLTQNDILNLHCFGTKLINSLSNALHQELENNQNNNKSQLTDFSYYPGIMKTIVPTHQPLQRYDNDDSDSYILHLPLCKEGRHLRIGWFDHASKTTKQKIIFIPFGSAILLKSSVWHGGHYGCEGNVCFVAILTRANWNNINVKLMSECNELGGFEFVLEDHYKTGLVEPNEVSKIFRSKVDIQKTQNAIKGMREACPGNMWLNLLN